VTNRAGQWKMHVMRTLPAIAIALIVMMGPAQADPAQIVAATAQASGDRWQFDVTLAHGDTGWDDYADGWRVELADGTILGTRILVHPHVDEQPFTRSLRDVAIPGTTDIVHIRAATNVTGWADTTQALTLN
jgi:hypothetical protein